MWKGPLDNTFLSEVKHQLLRISNLVEVGRYAEALFFFIAFCSRVLEVGAPKPLCLLAPNQSEPRGPQGG